MDTLVKKQIKVLLAKRGYKVKELVAQLCKKTSKNYTPDGFSHRLSRGTITYEEMLDIADILNYEIVFKDKEI